MMSLGILAGGGCSAAPGGGAGFVACDMARRQEHPAWGSNRVNYGHIRGFFPFAAFVPGSCIGRITEPLRGAAGAFVRLAGSTAVRVLAGREPA
jgi:hypothetical protein